MPLPHTCHHSCPVAPIATHPGTHPLVIFVARVGGILAGIATTFVLACILWPRSASDEVGGLLAGQMRLAWGMEAPAVLLTPCLSALHWLLTCLVIGSVGCTLVGP
jgi:hypothetical protein